MRPDLPSGTVTFLFTDVERSTRLLHELGAEAYAEALAEHRRVIREACEAEGGVEVDTQGDAFFFAFPTAPGALAAAAAFTQSLTEGPIQVRVGLHTGTPLLTEEGYVGDDVHRAARIGAAGHGGQVLVSASTAQLVDAALRDLGEHRFKDLAAAERVFQAGDGGGFPRLKSLYRSNLPVPVHSLVGRKKELLDVMRLLKGDEARIVTLTGPGGIGKTRFGVAVAGEVSDSFPDGVWFVPLSSLRDDVLVLPTVAAVLGAEGDLSRHIGDDECLIVLDNLEQVIDSAPDIAELVSGCPRLRVLVTSRESLRVAGEREYPLSPLPESPSVELFRQRAAAVVPELEIDYRIASSICDRVDRLPLAIELAAARSKALTPTQILERLSQRLDLLKGGRDVVARQQTLRATIEWSYELLSEDEQQLFARLSVFAGGCTLEAAEEVAEANLDTLQSLVEKSLVRFTNERYWMLETIREYAGERLRDRGETEEAQERHLELFERLADEAEPELRGSHASEWLDRLEVEHHNLRAALSYASEVRHDGEYVRLAGALGRFWWTRAYLDEGTRWLDDALARPGAPAHARARAFRGRGYLAWARGERSKALCCHEEALSLYQEIGDSFGASMCLMNLGVFWREEGDLPRARQLMEQAGEIQRASGDLAAVAHVLAQLGLVALAEGDLQRAGELCDEGLALARDADNDYTVAIILRAVAPVALRRGDQVAAAAHFQEGLAISMQLGYQGAVVSGLRGLAAATAACGDHERAARLLGAAHASDERLHGTANPPEPPDDALFLSVARSHLGDERMYHAWAQGRSMSTEHAVDYALASID